MAGSSISVAVPEDGRTPAEQPATQSPEQGAAAQFFLPADCFAAMACFFFCWSLLALVFFCVACLLVALGDLSPMMFAFRFTV
jgi:hypothetical protein